MSEQLIPIEEAEKRRKTNGQGHSRRIALVPFGSITLDTSGSYIVKGIIPDQGLTVIWGPPKCGKSFFTSDIALHVALGWPWRDRRVKSGSVVYLAAEGAHGFRARLEAFRQTNLPEEASAVPFYLVPVTVDLIGEHLELIGAIREKLQDAAPVLVVIDTLNRTLRGSENSDEDMSNYIKAADAIREAFECAVVVVHHCGVKGTRPRGHTSLSGAVDAQIAVKKSNGVVTATVELCKDGPEGEAFGGTLKVVEVGADEDGDLITSCVIEPADPAEASKSGQGLSAKQRRGMAVLSEAIIDTGEPSPGGPHYPDGCMVLKEDVWREYLFKSGILDPECSNPRQYYKRMKDGLIAKGAVRQWGELIWPTSNV